MPTARTRANRKYNEKAYDRIEITVPKGDKEAVQAHAKAMGESTNAFVNRAMAEAMERDKSKINNIKPSDML
jgi:hypothetical protein